MHIRAWQTVGLFKVALILVQACYTLVMTVSCYGTLEIVGVIIIIIIIVVKLQQVEDS